MGRVVRRAVILVSVLGALAGTVACKSGAKSAEGKPDLLPESKPEIRFQVRADSTDVRFFWFDDAGSAHLVERAEDVPASSRERVRVDPLDPSLRPAGWVFVTDLRAPGADGTYPVRVVTSAQLLAELAHTDPNAVNSLPGAAVVPAAPGASAVANARPNANDKVVIYGASWCSACHQAAGYMRAHNIPFIERDIEREPDAADELMRHAREQGVPTGSIPIIDVHGRLMVGFSPSALEQALRGT